MSATAYDVYSRPSFPAAGMAAHSNHSHLSPLYDVSPLLYPPTPLRDVSSSSNTYFPTDAQQQRFGAVSQQLYHEQYGSSSSAVTPSSSSTPAQQHSGSAQSQQLTAFLSSLTSTAAPPSPLSIHHQPSAGGSYFDYSDPASHHRSPQHDPLSFTQQQQLLQHRILQQQLHAKAAAAVPASPLSEQSELNSVSGGSAQGLFPASDSASSHSSQSPQQLSSVSATSSPSPLHHSALPLSSDHSLHSHSHTHYQQQQHAQPAAQQSLQPQAQSVAGSVSDKKRKGALSRKIACNVCHLAKTSCDGARPCSRCVRLLKTAQCVDRPSKMAKNKSSAAAGGVDTEDVNAAAANSAASAQSIASATFAGQGRPESSPSMEQSRRSLSATVEDGDVDDEHDYSDHSPAQSHSGDDYQDAASDHSAYSDDGDSSSFDSPSSPSAASAPLSYEAHISRSLLRAHMNWIAKNHDSIANPTTRMDLREKLIYFTWIRHMMLPEDVEHIVHFSEMQHREEGKDGVAPAAGRPAYTAPDFRRRAGVHRPCDGSTCNNFCPTARAWAAANPVHFTWHLSPEAAVPDAAANSHAVLVCRNLQDPTQVEKQRRTVVANTLFLRAQEKMRSRSTVEVASTSAADKETIHISPFSEDGAPAATPVTAAGSPVQQSPAADDPMQFSEADGGFDKIISMCGVTPLEMSRLHDVHAEQQQRDSNFESLALKLASNPPDRHIASDLLAASAPFSSVASRPLPPAPPIEVPLAVHVNPAFERLFGFSQAELRQHFIRDGGKALYALMHRDDWEKLMELDQEATWGHEQEYRTYAAIVNKWKGEVRCLVHTVYEMHSDGKFKQSTTSFIPLPDNKPPHADEARDRERERSGSRQRRSGGEGEARRRERSRRRKGSRSDKSGKDGGVAATERRRDRDESKRG